MHSSLGKWVHTQNENGSGQIEFQFAMEEAPGVNVIEEWSLSDNSSVPSFLSKRTRPMKVPCPDCDKWWRDKSELKRHRGYKKG
jgi:hypothetical protein